MKRNRLDIRRRGVLIIAASVAACSATTRAAVQTVYWDTNGTTPGAGTTPSGTWGANGSGDPDWTSDPLGKTATTTFPGTSASNVDAVFCAGNDAASSNYIITLTSTVTCNSVTLEDGNMTITGGTSLRFSANDATVGQTALSGALNVGSGLTLTMASAISGSSIVVRKQGAGTVEDSASSAYTGLVDIQAGTYRNTKGTAGSTQNIFGNGFTLSASGGTFDLNGRNETNVSTLVLAGGSVINSDTSHASATINATTINAQSGTVSAVIADSGTGFLSKTTSGTLTLSGANTYSGGTTINGGQLLVTNATGSGTGSGAVSVASGLLGGSGKIVGTSVGVAGGATLQAGNGDTASGTLSINGNLTMADNSSLQIVLGSGNAHSTLARAGGTWNFDSDQTFTLVAIGTVTSDEVFTNVITGLAVSQTAVSQWTLNSAYFAGYFTSNGTNEVDLHLTLAPEPSSLGVLGLGGLGLLRRRRRRSVCVDSAIA